MPAFYAEQTSKEILKNESQRDLFLVKMMHFMLLKRLESSWHSFYITVRNILDYHKTVLGKITDYQDFESENFSEDEMDEMENGFDQLGRNRKISISEIRDVDGFKNDLTEDVGTLQTIFKRLDDFSRNFSVEQDEKLSELLKIIKKEPKVLIFTTYKDTARYLHKHIFDKLVNKSDLAIVDGATDAREIEDILNRFAPLAKFKESEQNETCVKNRDEALKKPIKILISTDVLSEGQNLQDCDFVINYDIHWNPVKAIQRMGRIDRIGSEHKTIRCANFWPTENINDYLKLQSRVEKKMVAMKIAGSEIPSEFTQNLSKMDNDETLEQKQIKKNLKLMQESNIDEIEEQIFGLHKLSLEGYRQDLTASAALKYKSMPCGIFSGFSEKKDGIVALIKHKTNDEMKLIFIDMQGREILSSGNKAEILGFLQDNRNKERYVPQKIDECDDTEIKKLSDALNKWFIGAAPSAAIAQIDDLFAESQPLNMFDSTKVEKIYQPKEWNLLCWCLVSTEAPK
jgi:superfamily II DNA/RNA helicase